MKISLPKQFKSLLERDSSPEEIAPAPTGASGVGGKPDRHSLAPIVPFQPRGPYEWQRLHAESGSYGDNQHPMAAQYLRFPPKLALDIGCHTGALGAAIKEKYPDAIVWGVEPDAGAAEIARSRLDTVLQEQFESIAWSAEGITAGSFDTVFLMDVLEHLYDPWKALLFLRGMLKPGAQVVVSVPNVRNLMLMQDLAAGNWHYRAAGLLDVTHIRFFTNRDLIRMFYQTGFQVRRQGATFNTAEQDIYRRFSAGPYPLRLVFDHMSIDVMAESDLTSLCALQSVFSIEPADYDSLSDEEKLWVDGPSPETLAFRGEWA